MATSESARHFMPSKATHPGSSYAATRDLRKLTGCLRCKSGIKLKRVSTLKLTERRILAASIRDDKTRNARFRLQFQVTFCAHDT